MAFVWSEARIVREREARRAQQYAVTMQTVIASILGGKEAAKAFKELLKGMDDVG